MTGLASAWAMARRRSKEYRRKVDAATRCSGVCPHTCPELCTCGASFSLGKVALATGAFSATRAPSDLQVVSLAGLSCSGSHYLGRRSSEAISSWTIHFSVDEWMVEMNRSSYFISLRPVMQRSGDCFRKTKEKTFLRNSRREYFLIVCTKFHDLANRHGVVKFCRVFLLIKLIVPVIRRRNAILK